MEIIEGGCKYETIRNNAFWNNANLDTRFHPDASDCEQAVNHLIDCKNQPTIALLARKKYRTNNYPDFFRRNLFEMYESSKSVQNADIAYRQTFNKLYPKTGKARKLLINNESIVLNYVKPIQKTFKRILIKLASKF
jgi:hypothetical protein